MRMGSLTTDPAAILQTQRPLPIGYWKGAGMALVMDLLAALLSGWADDAGDWHAGR